MTLNKIVNRLTSFFAFTLVVATCAYAADGCETSPDGRSVVCGTLAERCFTSSDVTAVAYG